MTKPNKGGPGAASGGLPAAAYRARDPKTDPRPGDVYVPVYGPFGYFERVRSVDDGVIVDFPGMGPPRRYDLTTWSSGPGKYTRLSQDEDAGHIGRTTPWEYVLCVDNGPDRYDRPGTMTVTFAVPDHGEGTAAFRDLLRALRGVRV